MTFTYGMSKERYDYAKQAWVGSDGRYMRCWHNRLLDCKCYGKLHAGELALPDTQVPSLPSVSPKLCGCPFYSDCTHVPEGWDG